MERTIKPGKQKVEIRKNDEKESLWKPEFIAQAYKLALLGLSDKNIALFFNVRVNTLISWKRRRPELMYALQRGKVQADCRVAHALYRRAIGHTTREITRVSNKDGEVIRTEETIRQHSPDTFAALKWLSLRHPDSWGDPAKNQVNINYHGQMEISVLSKELSDPKTFSTEELQMALKLGLAQNTPYVEVNDEEEEDID